MEDKSWAEGPLSLRERDRVRGSEIFTHRARSLRKQATDAERVLWQHLRDRHLAGCKFRRQVVIENYIVDFACIEARLIIEADGGQHLSQATYDANRNARLEEIGYRIMRFWNHEILTETEAVLEQIHKALLYPPHPGPLPQGEGDRSGPRNGEMQEL